jgi:phage-related baseplate assembly protein
MADTFTGVDLSRLPAPTIVEPLDLDTIYAAMLAQLLPTLDAKESDPAVKVLQVPPGL